MSKGDSNVTVNDLHRAADINGLQVGLKLSNLFLVFSYDMKYSKFDIKVKDSDY
jgi:hypothetical protein